MNEETEKAKEEPAAPGDWGDLEESPDMTPKEAPEEAEPPEDPAEQPGRTKYFLVAVVLVLVIIIGLLVIPQFFKGVDITGMTITELHEAIANGEDVPDSLIYNGFTFVKVDQFWYFQWKQEGQLYNVPLRFSPPEAQEVPIEGALDAGFNNRTLFITFDPTGSDLAHVALAAAEMSLSFARTLDIYPIAACNQNVTTACHTRPIVTCDDNNKTVIFLNESEETKVGLQGNCIVINGQGMELLRGVDRMLYQWYRIMD